MYRLFCNLFVLCLFFLVLSPASIFAGDFAKFCAKDELAALEGAMKLAELAVKTRKSGCVGPGSDGKTPASISYPDEGNNKCVGVHYNHHDGSCGIKKSPREMLKDLGL